MDGQQSRNQTLRKQVRDLKNAVFWDVAPCSSCVNQRFGGTYCLHLQATKIRERGTSVSRWLQTARHHIPENGILHSHRENLRSYKARDLVFNRMLRNFISEKYCCLVIGLSVSINIFEKHIWFLYVNECADINGTDVHCMTFLISAIPINRKPR
jgi:hypothetical protein